MRNGGAKMKIADKKVEKEEETLDPTDWDYIKELGC